MRRRRWIGPGLLAVVLVTTARAAPAAGALHDFELRGRAQMEGFAYVNARQSDSRFESFFSLTGHGRFRVGSSLTVRAEAELVADDAGFTDEIVSYRNAERSRAAISLIEGAVDYRPAPGWRFSAGRQLVHWSGIDEIRPVDLLRSRDLSDVFRQRDFGLYSLSAHFEGQQVYADAVVVPMGFPLSTQPKGRWNIIDDDGGRIVRAIDVPPTRFDETQFGARLGAIIGALDVAVLGYVGRDASPTFVPTLEFVGGVDRFELTITDVYPKLRAGGLTASHPVGESLLLRVEAMYFSSPEAIRGNFVHAVAGAEYGWGDWRVVVNYLRDETTKRATEEVTDAGQRRFFRSFLFGELRYDGHARVQPRLRGGYDFTGRFVLVQPEISARAWRSLYLVLSANVVDGSRFNYFERIRNEDRIGLRAEWYL